MNVLIGNQPVRSSTGPCLGMGQPWLDGLLGDRDIESLFGFEAQLAHLRQVEIAWVEARATLGSVTPEDAQTVVDLIRHTPISAQALSDGVARDGVVIPAFIDGLRSAAPAPLRDIIHSGMTSQDVVDAAALLTARACNERLRARLRSIITLIDDLDRTHGTVRMNARTRMQRASTIRVSDRLAVWRAPLIRQCDRLDELEERLLCFGLGGADGTGCRSDELWQAGVHICRSLNLTLAEPRHSQRDLWAEYGSWLATVSGLLGKVGIDIALMAQQGIDEAEFHSAGRSSSMPHKQNPISAEILVVMGRHAASLSGSLHGCLIHEQERSGAAWTLEWVVLPQLQLCVGVSTAQAIRLLRSISRLGQRI